MKVELEGAIWTSWNRNKVFGTDGNYNFVGGIYDRTSEAVIDFVNRGGRIRDSGTKVEELMWLKKIKVKEIEEYACQLLHINESEFNRKLREAKGEWSPYILAVCYIEAINNMDDIDKLRNIIVKELIWADFTTK